MKKELSLVLVLCFAFIMSCGDDEPTEPENTAPAISAQSFNASESALDTDVFGTVTATDADGDALTFSITTNDNGLFEITNDGELSLAAGQSLDYETATVHNLSVSVSDGTDAASADITVNVIDVDENTAPTIAAQSMTIDENTAVGAVVGTIQATDAENDNLTYSTTDPETEFAISAAGEVTVAGVINFEDKDSHQFNVTVSDGMLSSSATLTIDVTDVNDAPVFNDMAVNLTAAEDIADTDQIGSLIATDEDGDDLTYSVTDDADDLFEVDNAGLLSLQDGKSLDFETSMLHSLVIVATDSDGATGQINVSVTVTDVDEPQVVSVTTVAGSGFAGLVDGPAATARFDRPSGLALADNGDLYITDERNKVIRKLTPDGTVSTFAGGAGTDFVTPTDLVFDSQGNLFVADQGAFNVFKVDPSGNITTFAGASIDGLLDGTGTDAQLGRMTGIAIDGDDNLYISDNSKNRIRKITPAAEVTTIIGGNIRGFMDGTLSNALFNEATDVAVDKDGNVFMVDRKNRRIRKVTPSGEVTTLAGSTTGSADGTGTDAQFNAIDYIDIDAQGNLYVADWVGTYKVRKITPAGEVTTLAGNGSPAIRDGDAANSSFRSLRGIVVSDDGRTLYVSEYTDNRIRKITVTN